MKMYDVLQIRGVLHSGFSEECDEDQRTEGDNHSRNVNAKVEATPTAVSIKSTRFVVRGQWIAVDNAEKYVNLLRGGDQTDRVKAERYARVAEECVGLEERQEGDGARARLVLR